MPKETTAEGAPPSFLRLAGHPVRWRLLSELAHSDRRVGELCARLELPQNLVSYHLGRLGAERVVSRRRSTADGRDSYYVLELDRCGELLAAAGSALHPGLRLAPAHRIGAAAAASPGAGRGCCSCARATARARRSPRRWPSSSAAARRRPQRRQPSQAASPERGARHCASAGSTSRGRRSKHLDEFAGRRFDYVVSLCDRVREVCPEFPGHPDLIHWSIPDPAAQAGATRDLPGVRSAPPTSSIRTRFCSS